MNGYLNIFKPTGLTSSNVVGRVRYNLKMKKVGHAGTLDPCAAGVLPVMVGNATKMFDYLNLDKKSIFQNSPLVITPIRWTSREIYWSLQTMFQVLMK